MSLILVANNFTLDPEGNRILERPDGSADYRVGIYINQRPIFEGIVSSMRNAAHLLHAIANQMQSPVDVKKPVKGTKIA